jgi:rhamnosyltransferase
MIAAVVPTYRPDPVALTAVLASIPVPVLVVDDASPCTSDPVLRAAAVSGPPIVRHTRNAGVARSLNEGLTWAAETGASWLLTVDQDSVLPPGYLTGLLDQVALTESILGRGRIGAIGAGRIDDASGTLGYPVSWRSGAPLTDELIQTGTLWSIGALIAVGGFDETLGIDAVDAAACLRLREVDRAIALAPAVALSHRVGAGRQVSVLGRSVLASGHSPRRRTSMVRNRVRLFPDEFRQSPVHALRTMRRVAVNTVLAVTIEDDRWAKAKASARGLLPVGER